jgi:hypothetical protein
MGWDTAADHGSLDAQALDQFTPQLWLRLPLSCPPVDWLFTSGGFLLEDLASGDGR